MIVIAMGGLSRRFQVAGYENPKYMLPLWGSTCFDYAIGSFRSCFETEPFVFVARTVADTPEFVRARTAALGIRDVRIVPLDAVTAGQAETVEIGLDAVGADAETPVTIFNIDTFRPGFRHPEIPTGDGYLEVFRGSGDNWSFVDPAEEGDRTVRRTTEKEPVSDLCCTGLYTFRRADDFREALAIDRRSQRRLPELYVAPIYNHLIARGADIRYVEIPRDEVIFCGVPAEYEELVGQDRPAWAAAALGSGT